MESSRVVAATATPATKPRTEAELRRELEAAQRALAERSRFLATASHDLRQPIHAIGLFAAALRAELPGGRPRELLDRLERAMRGLDDLFNRLLDISRIDGGQVACEPRMFALAPMLQTLEGRYLSSWRAPAASICGFMNRGWRSASDPIRRCSPNC
ncbi:MAG: histidine kinase dimerization/phospho-acceptor domain-containing protein [Burkholderiaceae bacterium]